MSHRRTTISAAVLASATLALAVGPAGAAEPTAPALASLDPTPPAAAAGVDGTGAWLRPVAGAADRLVVLDPGSRTPRVLGTALPGKADGLRLGSDGAGRPVAFVTAPKGVYTTTTAGSGPATTTRIAGSSRWVAATSYRGQVAWAVPTTRGRTEVRTAKRFGDRGSVAFTVPGSYRLQDLALARSGRVFIVGERKATTETGIVASLWLARAGHSAKTVSRAANDTENENERGSGFGPLTTLAGGTRVGVQAYGFDLQDYGRTLAWSSGKTVDEHETPADATFSTFEELLLDGNRSLLRFVENINGRCVAPKSAAPTAPGAPAKPACPTIGVVQR